MKVSLVLTIFMVFCVEYGCAEKKINANTAWNYDGSHWSQQHENEQVRVEVCSDEPFEMTCEVTEYRIPGIVKKYVILINDSVITNGTINGTHEIVTKLPSMAIGDRKKYVCTEVYEDHYQRELIGQSTVQANLLLMASKCVTQPLRVYKKSHGSNVTLHCSHRELTNDNAGWKLDGIPLPWYQGNVSINLTNLGPSDVGLYECTVKRAQVPAALHIAAYNLTVLTPPRIAIRLQAVNITHTEVTLSWAKKYVKANWIGVIRGYDIAEVFNATLIKVNDPDPWRNSINFTVNGSVGKFDLEGLSPGTVYKISTSSAYMLAPNVSKEYKYGDSVIFMTRPWKNEPAEYEEPFEHRGHGPPPQVEITCENVTASSMIMKWPINTSLAQGGLNFKIFYMPESEALVLRQRILHEHIGAKLIMHLYGISVAPPLNEAYLSDLEPNTIYYLTLASHHPRTSIQPLGFKICVTQEVDDMD